MERQRSRARDDADQAHACDHGCARARAVPSSGRELQTFASVNGLAAGFLGYLDLWPVNRDYWHNWVRYGLNSTGDTSQRELFLPTAGAYSSALAR